MAITGIGTSGSYVGLNEAMKVIFQGPVSENLVQDSELLGEFDTDSSIPVTETKGGRYIELAHYFSGGGGYGASAEGSYIPTPTAPVFKNSQLYLKKNVAVVEMTGEAYRRVKGDEGAFLDWGANVLPRNVQTFRHHLDRQAMGTGTGIIARVNMASPASADLAIDTAFGIAGLTGATRLFVRGMSLMLDDTSTGASPRTEAATVTGIDHANSDINLSLLPTSTTDNDYIFQGDANANGGGSVEMMGLLGMVDDGSVLSVFQGITRSAYPEVWNAQVVDASSGSFGSTLSEEVIVKAADDVADYGGGAVDTLICSTSGLRSYWKSIKPDRVLNDPSGSYEGGKGALRVRVGERVIRLKAVRKCPPEVAFLLHKASFKRWQVGGGFQWDDTTGSIWERSTNSTGRRDAYFAVGIFEGQLGCIAPAHNALIENLAAA